MYILFAAAPLIFSSCDEGISPEPEVVEPGFSGTVRFIGNWPADVKQTNLVLFKNPLLSAADFNVFNIKFISNTIPYGASIYEFNSEENFLLADVQPGDYAYLAVAQSKTDQLSLSRADWFVSGVYYAGSDTTNPGTLSIPQNTFIEGVEIIVDFNNPPPQPPGGLPQ